MREMKKTGVPWLPEIAEDFSVGYVKHYFYISKDLSDEGEPERVLKLARAGITEKDVTTNDGQMAKSYANYNKVQVDDLILNPMDLYSGANCNVSKINGVISPAYSNLRAKRERTVVPKFYDYYFKSQYWLMAMFAHGKGVSFDNRWTLNNDSLKGYEIPVIPYAVQQRIVERIQSEEKEVDALITNLQIQIEKLRAYKHSLITEVVTKGLDPSVPMKDSELLWFGMIPSHWKIAKVKLLASTCSGGTPPSGDMSYYDGDINWVCSYDLNETEITKTGKTLSEKGASVIAGEMQTPNSILIAMYGGGGTIGNSGLLRCHARTNQAICSVHFDESAIDPFFAFYQTMFIRKYWMYYAEGSRKDPNINQDIVRNMKYVIPPMNEQIEIVEYLRNKCSQINLLITLKQKKIDKLNEYKKSLIYEYVIGKKEVR